MFKFIIGRCVYSHPVITTLVVLILNVSGSSVSAQANVTFSDHYAPSRVGKIVTEQCMSRPFLLYGGTVGYPEVCTWYGGLKFASYSKDPVLKKEIIGRLQSLFQQQQQLIPIKDNVDHTVFGALALELYLQTGEKQYLSIGKEFADAQWQMPTCVQLSDSLKKMTALGLSWQTRLWIDDMYMITLLQTEASRATFDTTYLDRAAREMVYYLKALQKSNGLFFHAPDVPFYWGRGNGWMAAGMTEILKTLPNNNPNRAFILTRYRTMMRALLSSQANDGMWHQLVDDSTSWEESSSTGMFTYALLTGVRKGWLKGRPYFNASRKAWIALVDRLGTDGNIGYVCEGTNKRNDRQYYLDRKSVPGDLHGQAPVLWCAMALLE